MDIEKTVALRKKRKCGKLGIEHDTCIVSTQELDNLLNELDKKDKIIKAMGNEIAYKKHFQFSDVTDKEVIDYFTKKVEGK